MSASHDFTPVAKTNGNAGLSRENPLPPTLAPGKLQMRTQLRNGSCLIELMGELDARGCPDMEGELTRAYSYGVGRVVIDMSRLEFIDSSGIALLVATTRECEESSRRLLLVPSNSAAVQRLFELCDLNHAMPFVDVD